tara:strand:+ start:301 stop:486 length:186 start_codon:yes stop_codon:yes gene_type:complete
MKTLTVKQFIKWRQDLGISQDSAAKLLGYKDRSSVCNIEQGRTKITTMMSMACEMIKRRDG